MFEFSKRCIDRLEDKMNSGDEKGVVEYGKPLDPMDDYDWYDMAEEELADFLKYFNCERERRDRLINMVLKELQYAKIKIIEGEYISSHSAINDAIDKLNYLVKKR